MSSMKSRPNTVNFAYVLVYFKTPSIRCVTTSHSAELAFYTVSPVQIPSCSMHCERFWRQRFLILQPNLMILHVMTFHDVVNMLQRGESFALYSTVGKWNYFTGKVTYFTTFIGCGQISMNIVVDPFSSDFYTQVST